MADPSSSQQPLRRGLRRGPINTVRITRASAAAPPRDQGAVQPFPRERFLKFCAALKIQARDIGLTSFHLNEAQMYVLDEMCKALERGVCIFVILKGRQQGISTFFLALDMFWAFEHKGLLGAFVSHEEGARDQFRNQIDVFLSSLPKGYKVPQNKNNSKMLVLKNLSMFRYLVAGQRSGSNKLGRSGGCNYCHSTEVAFWGSADDLASLQQTFSEKYPFRLYVFESTANGFNQFETMWQIAQDSPAQCAIFSGWWRNDFNEFGEEHPLYKHYMPQGVKTPLNERERQGAKEIKEQFGFKITAGQIAWYRYYLDEKCGGDQVVMDQEQPWTPEDAFQSTGSIFFANEVITRAMKRATRDNKMHAFKFMVPERFTEMQLAPMAQRSVAKADLKIWEMPTQFGRYVIGVDPAVGTGNDESVVSIWRCFADLTYQVAEYSSADISTLRLAWVIGYLSGLYHAEMVHIEITGPGMSVLQELDRLKQDTHMMVGPDGESMFNIMARLRDFYYRRPDSMSGGVMRHWKQSLDLKRLLMDRFKNYFELDMAQVRSLYCLEQMRKMVISDTENIEASGNYHDDKPIAAALAVYAWGEWLVKLMRASHYTYARAQEIEKHGGEDPVSGLVRRFMAGKKIIVKDDLKVGNL